MTEVSLPDPAPTSKPAPVAEPAPVGEPAPTSEPVPAGEAAAPDDDGSTAPARPPRPKLRALARWTAAVLAFAVLGGASAYAVTRPDRTHVPGLGTQSDGRWHYPAVALPQLPAGSPRPLDEDHNPGRQHYADLRSLLLPLPKDAAADPAFPGGKGWLSSAAYLKSQGGQRGADGAGLLQEDGLRHIAARAWTMPDGTRTEVYLLQFVTEGYAIAYQYLADSAGIAGIDTAPEDASLESKSMPVDTKLYAYTEAEPYGATMGRYCFLVEGDTLAVVIQTRKGYLPDLPFKQTVTLQSQLLG
jgi:hypothetical protein